MLGGLCAAQFTIYPIEKNLTSDWGKSAPSRSDLQEFVMDLVGVF